MGSILNRNQERINRLEEKQKEKNELKSEIENIINKLANNIKVDVYDHWDCGIQISLKDKLTNIVTILDASNLTESNLQVRIEYELMRIIGKTW